MAGMAEAVERIVRAVRAGEAIVVYGDYDVDGLSGATLLALALAEVGGNAEVFIPHRERDGYGLNRSVLLDMAAAGARLLISVDCGVSAAEEVAAAGAAGLEVVVTDHHTVPSILPSATAVLNPRRPDCSYPFKSLSGAGVALKLAQAVASRLLGWSDANELTDRLCELAALGTIADVMPLLGENRAIVRRGLRRLNRAPSAGLAALCRSAGLTPGWVDAESVAFKLGPRLNAAGRVDDARLAHLLLAEGDPREAARLAGELEALNKARRILGGTTLDLARGEMAPFIDAPAAVVWGEYPIGLIGIVAARLAEESRRPVAVLNTSGREWRGSVRGVPGFDTVGAVGACSDLLLRFGGHAGAAGLTLSPSHAEAFRQRFVAASALALDSTPPPPGLVADCRLRFESIDWELCELLARLEPCGEGNAPPLFETRGAQLLDAAATSGGHIRMVVETGSRRLRAILFNRSDRPDTSNGAADGMPVGQRVDLVYRVRRNVWRDEVSIELEVLAWRPSATA